MSFDVLERLSPAIRLGHTEAAPHEASTQDDAVVLDVVDDKQTDRFVADRRRLRPRSWVEARAGDSRSALIIDKGPNLQKQSR